MSNQQGNDDRPGNAGRPGLEGINTPQKAGLRSMPKHADQLFLDMYITQKMKGRIKKEWETLERQTRGLRVRSAQNAATVRKQAEELIKSGLNLLGIPLRKEGFSALEQENVDPFGSAQGKQEAKEEKKPRPSEIFAKAQPFAKKKAGFKSMVWGKDSSQEGDTREVVIEPKRQKREPKEFKSLGIDY